MRISLFNTASQKLEKERQNEDAAHNTIFIFTRGIRKQD